MTNYQGNKTGTSGRFAIAVSRYNESISAKLLDGARATLSAGGVDDERIDVVWTPGAFELPLVADRLAGCGQYAAVLCLGAVIRGETSHDQHINRAVSLALMDSGIAHGIPVLFGVLTCDTLEQAIHRSGGQSSNKGSECAEAALEMVDLLRQLPK
jgi:6,7-dimethyl-8-ribityllumazine synthase